MPSFDQDKCYNEMLETYENTLSPKVITTLTLFLSKLKNICVHPNLTNKFTQK